MFLFPCFAVYFSVLLVCLLCVSVFICSVFYALCFMIDIIIIVCFYLFVVIYVFIALFDFFLCFDCLLVFYLLLLLLCLLVCCFLLFLSKWLHSCRRPFFIRKDEAASIKRAQKTNTEVSADKSLLECPEHPSGDT